MSDGKYFGTAKRGETAELKADLRSAERPRKKEAVKRVIAAMTVGADVSKLFPDLINCMQTDDLELKKLVYLYLINYAKSQPDLTIMAVNTFVKDTSDGNPLVRALAVRTMGCIRVDKITEYLCEPLSKCVRDEDPYVRKTAAVCIAKLHDINPELVQDRGFVEMLQDMLVDANPVVVANAVAALQEIHESSGKKYFPITPHTLTKLLQALNECTEWGQVYILDSLAHYSPVDQQEAESIAERVVARLQHANQAVVLAAVRVIMVCVEHMEQTAAANSAKKLPASLVTLLSAAPEVQYVSLRNINLVLRKQPELLSGEVKVFFCKYNDPTFVKLEKLESIVMLADENNIGQVLMELKEYAQEVDVEFVRQAVRAVGRCAVKLQKASEKCVQLLLSLISSGINYVVQEAVVVLKDIFRRYPQQYESVLAEVSSSLECLDESEAKGGMVWMLGEYAERMSDVEDVLEGFLDNFPEESHQVQLQLLTTTVKVFLKKLDSVKARELLSLVLTCATEGSDDPDLRDRAFVYWRLLSSDPTVAKSVVLVDRPAIKQSVSKVDNQILGEIGSLSSVYHLRADAFVTRVRMAVQKAEDMEEQIFEEDNIESGEDRSAEQPPPPQMDLLDLGMDDLVGPKTTDLLGGLDVGNLSPTLPLLLTHTSGLLIYAQITVSAGNPVMQLQLKNNTGLQLSGFKIQLNANALGFSVGDTNVPITALQTNATTPVLSIQLQQDVSKASAQSLDQVQAALNVAELGVIYFVEKISLVGLLRGGGAVEQGTFIEQWQALGEGVKEQIQIQSGLDSEQMVKKLAQFNIFLVAQRQIPNSANGSALYLSCQTIFQNLPAILMELKLENRQCQIAVKSSFAGIVPLAKQMVVDVFQ